MFHVLTKMLNGWENCWQEGDSPAVYPTREAAETALREFFEEAADNDLQVDEDDYMVEEIT